MTKRCGRCGEFTRGVQAARGRNSWCAACKKKKRRPVVFSNSELRTRLDDGLKVGVGRAIETARRRAGLEQAELAERVGCVQTLISHFERGERLPSLMTARRIAMALKVSADELLRLRMPRPRLKMR